MYCINNSVWYQYITSQRTPLNSLVDNHFECSICLDKFKGPNVYIASVMLVSRKTCPSWRSSSIISRRELTRKDRHLVGNIVSKVVVVVRLLPNELLLSPCVSLVCLYCLLLLFLSSGEQSSQCNHITRIYCEQSAIEAKKQTIEKSFVPIQCKLITRHSDTGVATLEWHTRKSKREWRQITISLKTGSSV